MAMPWTFEEDFIVCEFYFEHLDGGWKPYVDELMDRLAKSGYGQRERGSAIMRVQNYDFLHTGTKGLSRAANQTRRVYGAFSNLYNNATVHANFNNRVNAAPSNGITNVPTTIFAQDQTFAPQLGYLSVESVNIYNSMFGPGTQATFWEVLCKFIDQRGFAKDSDVYNACFVQRDVFSNIRNGKGVSKKTVFQLCFGLKLDADEAVVLLASAGYAFEAKKNPDEIVLKYLKRKNHDIFAANIELYDMNAPRLFA